MTVVAVAALVLWSTLILERSALYRQRAHALRTARSRLIRQARQLEFTACYSAKMSQWPGLAGTEVAKWTGSASEASHRAADLRKMARQQDRPLDRLEYAARHPWNEIPLPPSR